MNIEQEMYNKATEFIKKRYPEDWGGAAVIHTEEGSLKFVTLGEMQPYHWTRAYPAEDLEHFVKLNLNLK